MILVQVPTAHGKADLTIYREAGKQVGWRTGPPVMAPIVCGKAELTVSQEAGSYSSPFSFVCGMYPIAFFVVTRQAGGLAVTVVTKRGQVHGGKATLTICTVAGRQVGWGFGHVIMGAAGSCSGGRGGT